MNLRNKTYGLKDDNNIEVGRKRRNVECQTEAPEEEEAMNNKNNRKEIKLDVEWLGSLLECPVCLNVPRHLPIHQCSVGHIICKSCRPSITTCPTCRRNLSTDDASSMAAKMIEKVAHKCKYAAYGCQVKDVLEELRNHEEKCDERTVLCPVRNCETDVQLKKLTYHFKNQCKPSLIVRTGTNSSSLPFSVGYMNWDGVSKHRGQEFDPKTQCKAGTFFTDYDYLVMIKYCPFTKLLSFWGLMAKDPDEVEKYSAMITIESKDFETNFKLPIISIEEFNFQAETSYGIHYSTFRKCFQFQDLGGPENHDWVVRLNWSVQIEKN